MNPLLDMRDMTAGELKAWQQGQWPCGCGSLKELGYMEGPRGGVCRNIYCPKCDMELNVIDPQSGYDQFYGQVLREPPGYVPPEEDRRPALQPYLVRCRTWFKSNRRNFENILMMVFLNVLVIGSYSYIGIAWWYQVAILIAVDLFFINFIYQFVIKPRSKT